MKTDKVLDVLERIIYVLMVIHYWVVIFACWWSLTLFYFGLIVFNFASDPVVHRLGGWLAVASLGLYRFGYFKWALKEIEGDS